MRRLLALCLGALLLLASCTGTSEPRPPTLLIVGYQATTGPALALVEDVGPTTATTRVSFVAGSERPLLGSAVGIDLEDREGARAFAWVLTRSQATVGGAVQVSAWLQRFGVASVDTQAPSAFVEDAGRRVVLSGSGGVLTDTTLPGRTACPSAVQVSRTGAWAVVLDDPSACGLSGYPVQWLVNTVAGSAAALLGTSDVLAATPYTDQASAEERAYFLVSAPGGAQVFSADLTTPATWYQQARVGDGATVYDMAGSGSVLVGLTSNRLPWVDLTDPSAEAVPGVLDSSASATSRLVADPFGATSEVFVLGASSAGLYRTPAGAFVGTIFVRAAAGTIDPVMRFGYLLSGGTITVVDLLSGPDEYDIPFGIGNYGVPELTLATGPNGRQLGVLAWVRALTPAVLP